MNLRVRRIQFDLSTGAGRAGADLAFPNGLVVLRAENTSGKSSALQGILYGLGLEGMMGPSRSVPFPHAFTDHVKIEGQYTPVLESKVRLEIEGNDGAILTVERTIVGEERPELIRTWRSTIDGLREGGAERRDYYVRMGGAASSGRGFHAFLESFIGWKLPLVPRYDGNTSKLYMEAVFPLLFVEQKQGWSIIEGRFPTYLGIRQLAARAIEFLLDLDSFDASAEKIAIAAQEASLRQKWNTLRESVETLAKRQSGVVENLPANPTSMWPPEAPPEMLFPNEDEFEPLRDVIEHLRTEATRLAQAEIPRVSESVSSSQSELETLQETHARLEAIVDRNLEDLELDRAQRETTEEKLRLIAEDLRKYKDMRRLVHLGSSEAAKLSLDTCPTCHQGVADVLLPPGTDIEPMGLEENIRFLEEQRKTYTYIVGATEKALTAKERKTGQLMQDLERIRGQIRSLKRTLTSDTRLPSDAAIRNRIVAEQRLLDLEHFQEAFAEQLNRFAGVSDEWRSVQEQKAALPAGDLSEPDGAKLSSFRSSFVDQLRGYDFRSLDPSEISISLDNYRPVREGIDLQFDLSASDTIRTIWAYRLALLELASRFPTNHPGLLILDEPGQQEVKPDSFEALFQNAADIAAGGAQVIIATSEQADVVRSALVGRSHEYMEFTGFLIK